MTHTHTLISSITHTKHDTHNLSMTLACHTPSLPHIHPCTHTPTQTRPQTHTRTAEDLRELRRLEKDRSIEPDWNVDAFMKAEAVEGRRTSIMTEYIVRMLGLGICADTEVGSAMRRGVSGGQKKRVTSGMLPPVLVSSAGCNGS